MNGLDFQFHQYEIRVAQKNLCPQYFGLMCEHEDWIKQMTKPYSLKKE